MSMPMEPYLKLSTSQSPVTAQEFAVMHDIPYCKSVGSLVYVLLVTHLNIMFMVGRLLKFLERLRQPPWEALRHVSQYLKGTLDWELTYGEWEELLMGWVDMYGSQEEDRHIITGYAFLINGSAVSWNSKQQVLIMLSMTKGEYVASTHAAKEALWLQLLILEVFDDNLNLTSLFSNNQSAIALLKDHQYHVHTKHINIQCHFIHWVITTDLSISFTA